MMLISHPSNQRRPRSGQWLAGMLVLVAMLVFGGNVFVQYLSGSAIAISRPFWSARNLSASVIRSGEAILANKAELLQSNQELQALLRLLEAQLLDRAEIVREREYLRGALGRQVASPAPRQVARVLAGWQEGPLDILTVDIGKDNASTPPKVGDLALGGENGDLWLGRVAGVYGQTSKIRLFSLAGETIPVWLGVERVPTVLSGWGGGNFRVKLPLGVDVRRGDLAFASGPDSDLPVAVVGAVVPEDNGAEQIIFLRQPVSATSLKYVELQSV